MCCIKKTKIVKKFNKWSKTYVWTLVFTLYFNFGITIVETKIKIWTYFKSQEQELISKHENLVFEKNLRVITNFSRKHCLPVITSNKNNLLKQAVPITYTLEKRFFAVAILLKVCESFLLRQSKKICGMSLLWTSREEVVK